MKKQYLQSYQGLFFSLVVLIFSTQLVFSQRGKDGPRVITALNTVVNEYTILTADATAGANTITVNNSSLNLNSRFPAALSSGDLIMLIQVQGAELFFGAVFPDGNGNSIGYPKDSTWGEVANYNNCGNYELAQVNAVPNVNTIVLSCALKNNYTSAGKVLVVRVPRYTTLTVNAGASITCDTWNGTIGGIVAIETDDQATINGSINANGRGFRGGVLDNQSSFGSNDVSTDNALFGAEKGESIAGFQNDYNIAGGRYCKGAAANGGGGGNMHNGGGGGGGNGGDPLLWRAVGNPSNAQAGWTTAWNLEYAGLATITSTGGGRGGYTASNSNQNALSVRPGNSSWGGDNRSAQGGYGGRPLDYSTGKIFLAGGGGAGDSNNGFGGAGGRGGGLIYLVQYAAMTGSGSITANGADGANAFGTPSFNGVAGQDGAGGGGAGGTILISNSLGLSGIQLSANGGLGGNQDLSRGFAGPNPINEAQGPGGGGGGGYINTSFPLPVTVTGGANGTTDSDALTEFPPNGATFGGAGEALNNMPFFDIDVEDDSVCIGGSVSINATIIGTPPAGFSIEWYDAAVNGNLLFTGATFITPPLNSTTSYFVGSCPGHFRKEVQITVTPPVSIAVAGPNQTQCVGNATLAANVPAVGIGTWSVISGNASLVNPSLANSDVVLNASGTVVLEWTISSPGCPPSTDQVSITVQEPPTTANAGSDQIICFNNTTMNASPVLVGSGQWTLLSGTATIANPSLPNTAVTGVGALGAVLAWTTSNGVCPNSVDDVQISLSAGVTAAFAGNDQVVCTGNFSLSANTPTNGVGVWTVVSGNASLINPSLPNSDVVLNNSGTVVLDWTISLAGCPSSSDQITLTVNDAPDVAAAGPDQSTCTASVLLSANTPVVGNGVWSIVNGSATLVDPANPQSALNAIVGSSVTLVWSISNSVCPNSTDTIIVFSNPSVSIADAGSDQTLCEDTVALNAINPASGTGTWTIVSGSAIISNPNLFNSDIVLNTPGILILEWTISGNGCPSNSDQVQYTVQPLPTTSFAGINQSICGDNTQLSGNIPVSGIGSWTLVSGAGVISDIFDEAANVTALGQGANVFSWTIDNGLCPPSTSLVSINADLPPDLAIAGTDQIICASQTQLAGNVPNVGTGQWSLISGNANFVDVNSPTTIINNLNAGTVVLQWTIQNGICPPQSDQVQINVNAPLAPANAGVDQSICGNQITLSATLPNNLSGNWTIVSGDGTLVDPLNPLSPLQFSQGGTTILNWSVTDGVCPPVNDQVTITHFLPPTTPEAGPDAVTCEPNYTLQAVSVDPGVWTIVSGTGIIDVAALPNATISAQPGSTLIMRWTVGQPPCAPVFDEVSIRFSGGALVANAGPDLTIKAGEEIPLQSSASGTISWLPTQGLSCSDCPIPIANPLETTLYSLTVTDVDGCIVSDSVLITVDAIISIFIPTGFSPNNDGFNDQFKVRGLGVESLQLNIFDRMGKNIISLNDPESSWDGTFKGKKCNPGVYYYSGEIGTVDGKFDFIQGEITLSY